MTLIGLVTRFLQSLQGLKEVSYSDEYLSFDRTSRIVGWEFVDIALGQQFQAAKKSDIQVSTAGNWSKALSKDPRIVNIFASRLDRPIRPDPSTTLCRAWDPLPLHKDFLVASLSCVAKLSERLGHDSYHPALSANFNIYIPPSCCDPCDPADPGGCRRIADLRPRSVSLAEILPLTGAIMIANRKCERGAMCIMGADDMLQHLAIGDEHRTLCASCCGSDKAAPPEDFESFHDEPLTATVHCLEDCDQTIVSQRHVPSLEPSLIATNPRVEQSLAFVYEPSDRADRLAMPEEARSAPEPDSHAVLGSPTFAGQLTGIREPRVEIVDHDGRFQAPSHVETRDEIHEWAAAVNMCEERLEEHDHDYCASLAIRSARQDRDEFLSVATKDFENDAHRRRNDILRNMNEVLRTSQQL